jgi:hypothetical protein|tara:strand:+ start:2503 stop:2826 length:324 start_codon:yes stop_codon:yes gene_type:complete
MHQEIRPSATLVLTEESERRDHAIHPCPYSLDHRLGGVVVNPASSVRHTDEKTVYVSSHDPGKFQCTLARERTQGAQNIDSCPGETCPLYNGDIHDYSGLLEVSKVE